MGNFSREFSSTTADFKKRGAQEIAVDGESGECTVSFLKSSRDL